MITQIILNGTYLPQRSNDQYACWEDLLGEQLTMISGRVVFECRGKVWRAKCSYDLLQDDVYRAALAVLRSGEPFQAAVLPDNGDEMVSSIFMVESLTPATFAFSDGGKAVWRGLAFQIREVDPHD